MPADCIANSHRTAYQWYITPTHRTTRKVIGGKPLQAFTDECRADEFWPCVYYGYGGQSTATRLRRSSVGHHPGQLLSREQSTPFFPALLAARSPATVCSRSEQMCMMNSGVQLIRLPQQRSDRDN